LDIDVVVLVRQTKNRASADALRDAYMGVALELNGLRRKQPRTQPFAKGSAAHGI
jgi:hypothetical protein